MKKLSVVLVALLLVSWVTYGQAQWLPNENIDGPWLYVDPTYAKVSIGTDTPPLYALDVLGDINIGNSNIFRFGGEAYIRRWQSKKSLAIGKSAGFEKAQSVFIGDYAGTSNSGNQVTVLGCEAGYHNIANRLTALGCYAGKDNIANNVTAVGFLAGEDNQGLELTAVGSYAGSNNTGTHSCGFGYHALYNNTGNNVVAIGYRAGVGNTKSNVFLLTGACSATPLIYGDFFNRKVGIGTENPQSELAVNGTITAKEVMVTLDGWSDFVFADNYKLMPLDKLEKHIKVNKSLPGVPTEKEVLKNGVNLGEMQAKFLEKIEELTLYTITQEKRLTQLEKENEELKSRISALEK